MNRSLPSPYGLHLQGSQNDGLTDAAGRSHLILRFGGAAHYRTSQHFFMGLIMGEALCNGLWLVIDYFTGKVGNAVFILG